MDFVSWGTLTNAVRARDLSRIVAEVQTRGGEWVDGEVGLEPFLQSLYRIKIGSEGATDEEIAGMPKYVPREAIDAFRPAAAAMQGGYRTGRRLTVDKTARQGLLATFLNDIRTGAFGVDHRGSLARHWNAIGYNARAEVRVQFASDPHNLVLVSRSWNSSKSGEGENYTAIPGNGFTRRPGEGTAPAPVAPTSPAGGILVP
jgi:hypothetical protein